MGSLLRVKLRWSGFIGSPGYSVFHFLQEGTPGTGDEAAQGAAILVDTFASAIVGNLPAIGTLQVASDVEEIAESTGEMVTVHSVTGMNSHQSNAPGGEAYSGPTGAVINWRTGGVRRGRRVHGRTFLVPLRGTAFESNGTLSGMTMSNIQTAATQLTNGAFDAPNLGVYCRPSSPGATDGVWHNATAATVPDLAAVLRSRRD